MQYNYKDITDQELEALLGGKLHRVDGPALITKHYGGVSIWFLNGKLHREDGGPAVEVCDNINIWYLHGEKQPHEDTSHEDCFGEGNHYSLNGRIYCVSDVELNDGDILYIDGIKKRFFNAELISDEEYILPLTL